MNQPIDADGMVGHVMVDVRVQRRRRRASSQKLLLVQLEQREGNLEKERAATTATGCDVLRGSGIGVVFPSG